MFVSVNLLHPTSFQRGVNIYWGRLIRIITIIIVIIVIIMTIIRIVIITMVQKYMINHEKQVCLAYCETAVNPQNHDMFRLPPAS